MIRENWIKTETKDSRRIKAIESAEDRKVYESKNKFVTVRVDSRTVKLVLVK